MKNLGTVAEAMAGIRDAGKKPGEIFTIQELIDHLGDDEARAMFADRKGIPPAPSGISKGIGNILGGASFQLRRSGEGYIMPRIIPVVVDDTMVSGAKY